MLVVSLYVQWCCLREASSNSENADEAPRIPPRVPTATRLSAYHGHNESHRPSTINQGFSPLQECLWELRDIKSVPSRFNVIVGCAEFGRSCFSEHALVIGKCNIFQCLVLVGAAETQSVGLWRPNIK
jgi:hypothetical protein